MLSDCITVEFVNVFTFINISYLVFVAPSMFSCWSFKISSFIKLPKGLKFKDTDVPEVKISSPE